MTSSTGSSQSARDYLLSSVGMKPELQNIAASKFAEQRASLAVSTDHLKGESGNQNGSLDSSLSSKQADLEAAKESQSAGAGIKSTIEDEPESKGTASRLGAQILQKFGGVDNDKGGLVQQAGGALSSMFGKAKAMESQAKPADHGSNQDSNAGHPSLLHRLGLGRDKLDGPSDPNPELDYDNNKKGTVQPPAKQPVAAQHAEHHHTKTSMSKAEPHTGHETQPQKVAAGTHATGEKPHTEHKTLAHRLGLGKDSLEGNDPHPEINESKGTVGDRASSAWNSMFGNAKAMERQDVKPSGTATPQTTQTPQHKTFMQKLGIGKDDLPGEDPNPAITETKSNPSLKDKTKSAVRSIFSSCKAMEHSRDQVATKPEEPQSNVEKVSPFTGPLDGDAAGALNAVSTPSTGEKSGSEVKAPSLLDRTKEEFEAVGEALKEVVTGHKN